MSLFSRHIKKSFNQRARDFIWPRIGWKRVLTYYKKRLFRISDTPHAIAAGLASGIAVSFTPFIGFHLLFAAGLSILTRGNVIASVIGTLIGNPATFPFIWLGTYYLGGTLLGLETHASHLSGGVSYEFLKENFFNIFIPMSLAGILVGAIAWFTSYSLFEKAIEKYQHHKQRRMLAKRKLFKTLKSKLERRKRLKNIKTAQIAENLYLEKVTEDKYPLIEETAYTHIYDIGEEFLLKLSKRHGADLGDGDDKAEQERLIFHLLEEQAKILPFDVPVLIKSGTIPENHALYQAGFTLWTIISKVHGRTISLSEFRKLAGAEQKNIADTIGTGLYKFHKTLKKFSKESTYISQPFFDLYAHFYTQPYFKEQIDYLTKLYDKHIKSSEHLIHGNFSLKNLFFNESYMLYGVSDFYETQLSYTEKDIYRIICDIPEEKDHIIQSYEIISHEKVSPFKLQFAKCEDILYKIAKNPTEDKTILAKEIALLEKLESAL